MLLIVNGERCEIDGVDDLAALVGHLGMTGQDPSVTWNDETLAPALWARTRLSDGDRLEIEGRPGVRPSTPAVVRARLIMFGSMVELGFMTWLNFSDLVQSSNAKWLGHGGIVLGMLGFVYGISVGFQGEKRK
jgi:sulfur carrier protein ThiS